MTSEYKIIYRDSANEDLLKIIDYIERMTFSKERAEKFAYELVSEIIKLMFFLICFKFYIKTLDLFL